MFAVLLALSLLPIHATVLGLAPGHTVVASTRGSTAELAPGAYRFAIPGLSDLKAGTGLDGLLDRSTQPWTLRNAIPARRFVAGLPQRGRTISYDLGDPLPHATLVDAAGKPFDLATAFHGKALLLSFIYTRCPPGDLCPLTSAKMAQLQNEIDPARMHLLEITIDPNYDSPAVLRTYAKRFGARASRWTLATGTGMTIQRLLDGFSISSIEDTAGHYVHNDELFIVAPNGKIAFVARSAAWIPGGVLAEAQSISGEAHNPFELFKLSLVASVVALCGGSEYAGIVLLDVSIIALTVLVIVLILWRVGRAIARNR